MDVVNQNNIEEKVGYKDILRQKEYMKNVVAGVINRFGDSIDSIAFTWLVYAVTGSAAWTAIIYALNRIPSILLQPFAGVLVSNMSKKRVVVSMDLLRGIVVAAVALLYGKGLVTPFILAIFTLIISSAEAFNLPAATAMLPKILDKKYYSFGTSLKSSLNSVSELIGMGLAGVIIGCFGVEVAIIIDAMTFVISALIKATIRMEKEILEKKQVQVQAYLGELKDGFVYVKTKKVIFNYILIGVVLNAIVVPLNALQTPMAVEIFGLGSELQSVFGVAFMVGMGLGSFFLPYLMQKLPIRTIMTVAGTLAGVCYSGLMLGKLTYGQVIPSYILCATVTFFLGLNASWVTGMVSIQVMKFVEEQYLARTFSIFNASASAATPIMSVIISAISLQLSVSTIFLCSGIGCMVLFLYIGIRKVQVDE